MIHIRQAHAYSVPTVRCQLVASLRTGTVYNKPKSKYSGRLCEMIDYSLEMCFAELACRRILGLHRHDSILTLIRANLCLAAFCADKIQIMCTN